jgi:hypothetical protein
MTLTEQLAAEHAAHDPHNIKHPGEQTVRHQPVNAPYFFQKFPLVVYKAAPDITKTVANEDDLQKALADGFLERVPSDAPVQSGGASRLPYESPQQAEARAAQLHAESGEPSVPQSAAANRATVRPKWTPAPPSRR